MSTCLSCRSEFHVECNPSGACCCNSVLPNTEVELDGAPPVVSLENSEGFATAREFYAQMDLKDPHSTGRKRAKKLYDLDYDAPCEWRGLKNAGGGEQFIVGCFNGKQQSRHHGPDKNTLNNTAGNVHRICHDCHNNWHALNDPGYIWGKHITRTPHDSVTTADPEELAREVLRRQNSGVKNITRNQGD